MASAVVEVRVVVLQRLVHPDAHARRDDTAVEGDVVVAADDYAAAVPVLHTKGVKVLAHKDDDAVLARAVVVPHDGDRIAMVVGAPDNAGDSDTMTTRDALAALVPRVVKDAWASCNHQHH